VSHRETNQNLVPEQADEVEEGDPGDQGAERAGEASSGGKGSGCAGATALRLRSTSRLGLTSPEVPRGLHHQPPSVTKGRGAPVIPLGPKLLAPKCDGEPGPGPGKNPDVVDPSRLCLCLPVCDLSETVDSP